jgi:hypothetical protein
LFKISVYEIQQADFYKSQRTTCYHIPPPANLFQNASNFFKQRLTEPGNAGEVSIGAQIWTTEAGYRPVFAGCLPLKCDFFIFFQKTSFYVVFCVWQPAFIKQTPRQTLMFSTFDFL